MATILRGFLIALVRLPMYLLLCVVESACCASTYVQSEEMISIRGCQAKRKVNATGKRIQRKGNC